VHKVMRLVDEFQKNHRDSFRLLPKYFWITTAIGLLGVTLGFALVAVFWFFIYPESFNLGVRKPAKWSDLPIILSIILSLCVFLYVGVVIVASIFSLFMLLKGLFTREDAIYYSLVSRYPHYWFPKSAQRRDSPNCSERGSSPR
jgi:hypothetical protein